MNSVLGTYPAFWTLWFGGFLLTALLTGGLYVLAQRRQLLPAVRARDVHSVRKPRIGGVGMWLAAIILLSGLGSMLGAPLVATPTLLQGIIGGLLVILLFGLLDDIYGLPALWQLAGQVVAGATLVMGGLTVDALRLPLLGQVAVTPFWSAVLVVGWVVVMINAINLFDGLDGLAGSIGFTASLILFLVSVRLGFPGAATLCLIILGVTSGFLPWNWHPSRIFMGSVGSTLLGFLLATVALMSGAKLATSVLVLGIPLFDALSVVLRRLRAGVSPFAADQRHLHHRLLRIGLKPPQVVLLTNLFAGAFGILALSTEQANQKGLLILLLIGAMLLFIFITHLLERRVLSRVD